MSSSHHDDGDDGRRGENDRSSWSRNTTTAEEGASTPPIEDGRKDPISESSSLMKESIRIHTDDIDSLDDSSNGPFESRAIPTGIAEVSPRNYDSNSEEAFTLEAKETEEIDPKKEEDDEEEEYYPFSLNTFTTSEFTTPEGILGKTSSNGSDMFTTTLSEGASILNSMMSAKTSDGIAPILKIEDSLWKWIEGTNHIKVEHRIPLLSSIATLETPNLYWVYAGTDRTVRSRKRVLRNLVLEVSECSSFWQRQIFGSWREFSLSFLPVRWNTNSMSSVKLTRHGSPVEVLSAMAASNFDTRPRNFIIRRNSDGISSARKRSFNGSFESHVHTMGQVVRTLTRGTYVFHVYDSHARMKMLSPAFVFEPDEGGMCCTSCCGRCVKGDEITNASFTTASRPPPRDSCCSYVRQCLAKCTCSLIRARAPKRFFIRENLNIVQSGAIRGPIIGEFVKSDGFFHIHFREENFGAIGNYERRLIVFAASFYVDFMSYSKGELPDGSGDAKASSLLSSFFFGETSKSRLA